ncbi:hypothetical protein AB5N19_07974 [Seiridium cardinale]
MVEFDNGNGAALALPDTVAVSLNVVVERTPTLELVINDVDSVEPLRVVKFNAGDEESDEVNTVWLIILEELGVVLDWLALIVSEPDWDSKPLELTPPVGPGILVPFVMLNGGDTDDSELASVALAAVGRVSVSVPPLAVTGIVVMPGTWRDNVVLENGPLVLLVEDELCGAVVVDVRLPVAGMLVRIVALPVVSEDEAELVPTRLEVGKKGVTVRVVALIMPDEGLVGPTDELLLKVGNGGVLEDPAYGVEVDLVSPGEANEPVVVSACEMVCPLEPVNPILEVVLPDVYGAEDVETSLVSDKPLELLLEALCIVELMEERLRDPD